MDFLIELIFELVIDGCIQGYGNKKIPKFLRFILLLVVVLFFVSIVALIVFLGSTMLKQDNVMAGILMIILSMFLIYRLTVKCKKVIDSKNKK